MTIGLFFILLAVLLAIALPVGGVFGLMAVLPNLMGTIKFAPVDVVRAMFSGMNSFTLLAGSATHSRNTLSSMFNGSVSSAGKRWNKAKRIPLLLNSSSSSEAVFFFSSVSPIRPDRY